MGCISSKVMARSISYRQEMKGGSQRIARGAPALSEDILVPRKGSNHFLALVCTATTMTDRRQSGSFTFESPISGTQTEDIDAINIKSHPVPVVNKDQSTGDNEVHSDPPKRSRSWHSFPSEEMPLADTGNCTVTNGALEENNKSAIRSRSFHTVEEYEGLLERIWYASLSEKGNTVEESEEKEMLTSPVDTTNQTEEENADSQETLQPSQDDASLVGESNASSETIKDGFPGDSSSTGTETNDMEEPSLIGNDILGEISIKEEAPQEMPLPLMAKGFKRKSIARGLDVLKIPSTFELPAVASLREWLPEGQVFSPGVDPTPKFRSYSVLTDNITNKSGEGTIFNDELVLTLEEQLQHLKAEEEAILKQITATWEVSGSTVRREQIERRTSRAFLSQESFEPGQTKEHSITVSVQGGTSIA